MYLEKNDKGMPSVKVGANPKFKPYSLRNIRSIPQIQENFSEEQIFEMEVVGNVLPFKSNNYVVNKLIDWKKAPDDPIFTLTFPKKEMLRPDHYDLMARVLRGAPSKEEIRAAAHSIRLELNPHPAGQLDYNVPVMDGKKLSGMQHKYNETALFFPRQGQTCHAYCTFCFRWPQFIGMDGMKFAMKEITPVIEYIRRHTEITDILFTGGDPMTLSGKIFSAYINAILDANLSHLQNIRIGTKALAYWPYKFTTDHDSDIILRSFERIRKAGKHVAIMAHFNHYHELQTEAAAKAIRRINESGAQIRSQSPILKHINADEKVWSKMWKAQVRLRIAPYYMFMARETGAKHFFNVTLEDAWHIFRKAYNKVSGLGRTVRGPVMSCGPGKVQMLGVTEINGGKVIALRFIQGRNPDWVHRPFFAEYNSEASWLSDLKPAFGEKKFFFEDELQDIYTEKMTSAVSDD